MVHGGDSHQKKSFIDAIISANAYSEAGCGVNDGVERGPHGWRLRGGFKLKRGGGKLLIAMIACALVPPARAAEVDWSTAQPVTLTTVEYAFQPNHLILRRDTTYRLHVKNDGRELHELTAPDFFKAVELRNPEALNREHTEFVLQPNEQKDLYFATIGPGHYQMWCADHDWAGMTGDITVE